MMFLKLKFYVRSDVKIRITAIHLSMRDRSYHIPEREHVCPPTCIQPQLLTINKTSDENPTAMSEPLSSF